MSPESLTKKSSYAEREERILAFWEDQKIFQKTLTKKAPLGDFIFYEGPPTANGRPGIHHLASRAFKDAFPRYKTMRGYYVRRKGGWDTHGLPVELEVEKQLGLASKKDIESYGIEAFNHACRQSVWTYLNEWQDFTKRIGYWLDMDHPYITYDEKYVESLWWVMKQIADKNLLYKDYKIVPWCPRCGTGLSSHELAQGYADVKDISIIAKFKVSNHTYDRDTYILAWTTTPWTLPGNVALAVGASITYARILCDGVYYVVAQDLVTKVFHGREYAVVDTCMGDDLAGMTYEPLFPYMQYAHAREPIPHMENAYAVYAADFVTTGDGTGVVHTAVMYGQDDFELGNKVSLPKFHIIHPDGAFKEDMGVLSGRFIKEMIDGKPTLDIDIIKHLQETDTFFAKEKYDHNYPHCWRCKTPLVYYARDSWYINMQDVKADLIAENQSIAWHPEYVGQGRFGEWLQELKDWAISRERYWGTPLPLWQSPDGDMWAVGGFDDIYRHAEPSVLTKMIIMRHAESEKNIADVWDASDDTYPLTATGRAQAQACAQKLKDAGIDIIVASPVRRTRETAEIIAREIGATMHIEEALREIDSGNWEGKTYAEVKESRDAYNALDSDAFHHAIRGDHGESWQTFDERVSAWYRDVCTRYAGKTILVVSHFANLVYIFKNYKNISHTEASRLFTKPDFGVYVVPTTLYIDQRTGYAFDPHRPFVDTITLAREGKTYTRVPEVIDVWFDSGAMPFAQDHYMGEGSFSYPADVIAEGMDQTRGWFYTLHAIGNLLGYGKAYKNVISLGLINDAQGQKMSKSKGNTVNPWDAMNTFGVDTIRFWMYSVSGPGDAKSFDEKTILETQRKVFGLLDNVVHFYELYRASYDASYIPQESPHILDQWILARLHYVVATMTHHMDAYRILESTRLVRDFIADLSQWYIRRSRDRFKETGRDMYFALATTQYVLDTLARLMAPFAPFFAEDMYQRIEGAEISVHMASWPTEKPYDQEVLKDMDRVRTLISEALELRAQAKIKVRQPLQVLTLTGDPLDETYEALIKDEVNVKDIAYGDTNALDTTITDALRAEGDVRELVRHIQNLRKDKGLHPDDRIHVVIDTDDAGKVFFDTHAATIQGLTNIATYAFGSIAGDAIEVTHGVYRIGITE
ncbi:MAG: class I tRNA ligase family protein [Candidatus Pacebacteria bacterium]|nr:class I tRNA ligase family protein [Candidatus Paceibacterota bacterium]MCD8563741.1 class I tRNA ligase family protein [Candidatus Paceibacterota bacterium]